MASTKQAVKIEFKLGKKIQFIKLEISNYVENVKNQVHIPR